MEPNSNVRISIPLCEYRELVQKAEAFSIMKGILFQNAELSYNGKALRFDDECLQDFLCTNDVRYERLLNNLQEAKRIEEEKILKESEEVNQ